MEGASEEGGFVGEGGEAALEDALDIADEDAVVGDGDSGAFGVGDAAEHLVAVDHASAAGDGEAVGGEVAGRAGSCDGLEDEVLAGVLSEPAGDFDAADVVGEGVVGAGFEDEDTVAVLEAVDGLDVADIGGEVAADAGEEDGEGGEGDVRWGFGDGLEDGLGVADDEVGPEAEGSEDGGEFAFLDDEGEAVVVEGVADDLDLGEDEASLGRAGVDGDDEEDEGALADEVAEEGGWCPAEAAEEVDESEAGFGDALACEGRDGGPWDAEAVEFLAEGGVVGGEVGLVEDDEDGFGGCAEAFEEGAFPVAPGVEGGDEEADVGLAEDVLGAVDAEASEFGGVVESGGVEEDDGAESGEFHGLVDGVGGGSGDVGDDGDGLAGEGVDEGGFAGVGAAEDGDVEAVGERGGVHGVSSGLKPRRRTEAAERRASSSVRERVAVSTRRSVMSRRVWRWRR